MGIGSASEGHLVSGDSYSQPGSTLGGHSSSDTGAIGGGIGAYSAAGSRSETIDQIVTGYCRIGGSSLLCHEEEFRLDALELDTPVQAHEELQGLRIVTFTDLGLLGIGLVEK